MGAGPVTAADKDEFLKGYAAANKSQPPEKLQVALQTLQFADRRSSPKPTTWSVLGTDGKWVADVVLPARFSLLDAGKDYVAGIKLDDDDVETVVVYPLRR